METGPELTAANDNQSEAMQAGLDAVKNMPRQLQETGQDGPRGMRR